MSLQSHGPRFAEQHYYQRDSKKIQFEKQQGDGSQSVALIKCKPQLKNQ